MDKHISDWSGVCSEFDMTQCAAAIVLDDGEPRLKMLPQTERAIRTRIIEFVKPFRDAVGHDPLVIQMERIQKYASRGFR